MRVKIEVGDISYGFSVSPDEGHKCLAKGLGLYND